MPANGTLCSGRMCLQTRCSAKESGHSLELNGPLQTREHSLPVIRRKKGALDRLYSKQEFHSLLLYDNMYAHVLYWEGLVMQSGILPRRFYKNKPHLICTVLLLRPELCLCLFLVCVSCLYVISLATSGAQRGARVKPKGWVTQGGFYIHSRGTFGKIMGNS